MPGVLRGPQHRLRYGGSTISSSINDAYSATWISLKNLFFRFCEKVICSPERMQPVTEWAAELVLSFNLIWEAPNRSAGGGMK
jgi:hypothetical protein